MACTHQRREERDRRRLALLSGAAQEAWTDAVFEPGRARATLAVLSPMHRAVLTLRYLDDLRVADVASHIGRSVEATETLLMRAKRAFRTAYECTENDDV